MRMYYDQEGNVLLSSVMTACISCSRPFLQARCAVYRYDALVFHL